MRISLSRFTPGLENGKDVSFRIGDKVNYRCLDGIERKAVIKTSYMQHGGTGAFGYEAQFDDGYYFIDECRIIGWDGKGEFEGEV